MILTKDFFDTHKAIKEFSQAGFEEHKAELIIKYLTLNLKQQQASLITKDDLEITKLSMQKEIESVRREIEEVRKEIESVRREVESVRREIKEVELSIQKEISSKSNRIIMWVAGMLVANTGIIISLLKLL